MSASGPVKISLVVITFLLAMPLSAQRYQGHDHLVFHPPIPAKHQSVPSTGGTTRTDILLTGKSSMARGHDANLNPSHNEATTYPYPATTETFIHIRFRSIVQSAEVQHVPVRKDQRRSKRNVGIRQMSLHRSIQNGWSRFRSAVTLKSINYTFTPAVIFSRNRKLTIDTGIAVIKSRLCKISHCK